MPDKKQNGLQSIADMFNEYSIVIFFIVLGAIANAMMEVKKARKEREHFNWIDFSASFFIAVFSGMVFSLGAGAMGGSGMSLGLAGSIGAFLGVKGLNRFADHFLEKVAGKGGY